MAGVALVAIESWSKFEFDGPANTCCSALLNIVSLEVSVAANSAIVLKFDEPANACCSASSILRRFIASRASLALSKASASRFFVFWQLRL
jgi:hypothetical protein